MAALTTREKAGIAADLLEMLPSSAQVRRASNTSDSLGGRSQAWSTVATVACRISPNSMNAAEGDISDKILNSEPYRIAFPVGTDVRVSDRILISGVTYSVEGVRDARDIEIELVTFAKRAAA
jgi:hypothetical protein